MTNYSSIQLEFDKYGEFLPVLATVQELRFRPTGDLQQGDMIKTSGNTAFNDGIGGDWVWDPNSQAVDDGASVIAPFNTPVGRWLKAVASQGVVENQLGTATNLAPSQAAVRNTFGAPSGANLVGFKQNGVGTVPRSVLNKLNETVSAEDFGAVCDGYTDDSAALQKAVDELGNRGGGVLVLPARHVRLNSTVYVRHSGIHIEGSGHGCTWIVNGQTNAPALQIGKPTFVGELFYRNAISNVVFGQADGVTPVAGNCGLLVINQSNFVMSNIQVFQFPSRLYDGIIFDKVAGSQITVFGIQECLNRGLAITNQSLDIYVSNGRSDGNKIGIEFRDVQGMYFTSVACYGNTQYGLNFVTDYPVAPAQGNRYFQFFNVVGDTSGSHNWNIRQLSLANFVACWASTQLKQNVNTETDGFYLSGDNVEDITLVAPMAASNNRHGINLDYCRSVVVQGARLGSGAFPEDWGGAGANNGKGGYGSGLFVGAGSSFSNISGGHYQQNTDYGIAIQVGAQRVRISNVDLEFNQKGGLLNLAAAGQVRVSGCPGFNPRGYLATPAVPGNNVEITNPFEVDCLVYVAAGMVSSVRVNGQGIYNGTAIAMTPPLVLTVPVGGKIAMTYTTAPLWQWQGL